MNRGACGWRVGVGPGRSVLIGGLVAICCLITASQALAASPPSSQIGAPADHQTFALNQSVGTNFSCVDGADAPGLSSCIDSTGASGSADTGFGSYGA